MRLTSVRLRNFRGYRDSGIIRFGELTAFVARNDSGKSTVLEALDIFLDGGTVKFEAGDFCVDGEGGPVEITCTFADLPPSLVLDSTSETSLAAEYLVDQVGELQVSRRWSIGVRPRVDIVIVAQHPSNEGLADLLLLKNSDLKSRYKEAGSPGKASLANNVELRRALFSSVDSLDLQEVGIPVNAVDVKAIWERVVPHLPVFALFQSDRASKDSDSEVQNPMKLAIESALADDSIAPLLEQVREAVRNRALDLAERTGVALAQLDAELAGTLVPTFKADPKWSSIFGLELADERGVSVNKRGSGVRRLIVVSFFRADAERRRGAGGGGNIIYALEEPETSQHPRNQRLLLDSLRSLASEEGCQVVMTTHSPHLASLLPAGDLRSIRVSDQGPEVYELDDDALLQVSAAMGVVPDSRVRVLVCVEGPHDVSAIKAMSRALSEDDPTLPNLSSDQRFAFIPLGGSTLQQWVDRHYLRALNKPEVHIYDSDVAKYADTVAAVNARTDGSWAVLTKKWEMENYLHADAIEEALDVKVPVDDEGDVPAQVATLKGWTPRRAKRGLATHAFPLMTSGRIAQRDPDGEVRGWLQRLAATAAE